MHSRLLIPSMALFQVGFGVTSGLVLGALNRVMFAEIGLPATLIGFLLAIPSLISSARLWLGYLLRYPTHPGTSSFPLHLQGERGLATPAE